MRQSERLPDHVIRITTYQELEQFGEAFAAGHLTLLILLGGAGVGKTQTVRQAVGAPVCWLEGSASAFGIFCQLWHHRHEPVVLDDIDRLYSDREGVRLLKCLAQSTQVKTVGWHSAAPALEREGIPRQFTTTSRVAILGNRWRTPNADVAALQDRGHMVVFEPSALEVHRRTSEWFWDQEVFDYIAEHLHLIAVPSMRHYLAAAELKRAGLDWRGLVLSRCLSGKQLLVARLKADPAYQSEEERAQAFIAAGWGCRATYFNYARKLRPTGAPPGITLTHSAPPVQQVTSLVPARSRGNGTADHRAPRLFDLRG